MDYADEQRNEKEALQSIYPDAYSELDATKYKLSIYPYTVESDTDINYVGLTLQVAYPDTYPEVAPEINIFSLKGLTKKDCDELKTKLDELANENIGAVMVFTLVSAAQEWLLEHNDARTEQHIEAVKQESAAYEEQEEVSEYEKMMNATSINSGLSRYTLNHEVNSQFESKGTPVTIENFKEWKAQFEIERQEVKAKLATMAKESNTALPGEISGRQFFEQKSRWFAENAGLNKENGEQSVFIDEDLFLDDEEGYE